MGQSATLRTIAPLVGGEAVAIEVIEIVRIPHIDILSPGSDNAGTVAASKQDFVDLLFEVYQSYRGQFDDDREREVAIELLWRSDAVRHQPHRADIRLFIVIRAVGSDRSAAERIVDELSALVVSSLTLGGFDYAVVDAAVAATASAAATGDSLVALVKEEWIEELRNQVLPHAFAFERIPAGDRDLSRLAGALVEFPSCRLSIQLLPTKLVLDERAAVERTSLALTTLGNGILDQAVGTVSFHAAAKLAGMYGYLEGHKDSPLFLFNILVGGPVADVPVIASRVLSHLSADREEGAFGARFVDVTRAVPTKPSDFPTLPWRVNEIALQTTRDPELWGTRDPGAGYFRLPFILTAFEAAELFRLPIAGPNLGAGLSVNTTTRHSRNYSEGVVGSSLIGAGRLSVGASDVVIGFNATDLTKHMFVTGTPGSGKTTFTLGLLDRLWREHRIPYLVIEPAKNEYRALIETTPDLQVFSPGKDHLAPLLLNPFLPPRNVRLQSYKSTLKTAFAAALTMATPLDKIFEEAVNNAYSRHRWLNWSKSSDGGEVFSILDFLTVFQETFARIGYTGDAANIGRAGYVRLNSLVPLFDNYHSTPIEDLLSKPTVIELAGIENSDEKALYIALLLLSIQSYVNANLAGDGVLKNVLLLEEAHVLLDADEGRRGDGEADAAGIAKKLLKRMLAEIRSYGVGIVIADQSPRKVSADIIALTNIKMGFRMVEAVDKDMFVESTNASAAQREKLARLRPGEALFFYDRLDYPEEIVTADFRADHGIPVFVSDADIADRLTYWQDRSDLLVPYPECRYLDDWDVATAPLAKELARRIFAERFDADSTLETLKGVYRRIARLLVTEVPGNVEVSRSLVQAVKVNLLRLVKYYSTIPLSDATIRRTLEAERTRT